MKSRDAIIIGAGIIGLSLALELRKRGMSVLVLEKGEPGREASWAAGGMLADFPLEMPRALCELATASARMYPAFVAELESESGSRIDLRAVGTLFLAPPEQQALAGSYPLPLPLNELEPELRVPAHAPISLFLKERCVDPRGLLNGTSMVTKKKAVDLRCGETVVAVDMDGSKATGVRTKTGMFSSGVVVNCAGAWAGQIAPVPVPTRPVKGQMLSVATPKPDLLRHVVRTPDVYLIPRGDGRLVIGATSEEAGFDKQVLAETIEKQRQAAVAILPSLEPAPALETWTGLRPGTPDALPILGPTSIGGYFVATGHYRDGILLAPVTARVVGQLIAGEKPEWDLSPFAAKRFQC